MSVVIRTPFTCASCGGQFYDRHSCPSMPWGNTAPGPILVPAQSWPSCPVQWRTP